MTAAHPSPDLPLSGVTVIEFCNVAAGPFCGMLLADMGARIVKVESPSGDTLRHWPPMTDGFSENFLSLNRNKQSIALDLKDPGDNAIAVRLIETADVVIENNRAGVMQRLGLGHDRFAAARPDLIYCSLSAFGQSGPRAAQGGFDVTVQAISGIMSVTGEADGAPVKCGVPVSDFATGLYGAFAVATLISRVRAGGPGGFIDISMMGASLAIAALQTSEYFGSGKDPRRLGAAHPRNAPYAAFRAADAHFVIAAGNDRLWRAVCEVVDMPDLAKDPRFGSTVDRAANQTALGDILNEVFATGTARAWLDRFEAAGVPCAPINSYSEALADPQTAAMGWVQEVALPGGAPTRTFASPLRIDGAAPPIRSGAPALGADRDAVLAALDEAERRAKAST
ncbi:CoA transferase [Geminicoccaceae bacterium 1502E]|nr:CoA transferase [Geminicoccaceae bacterium 1502E]